MARAMSLKGKVATFKQLQNIIKKGRENEYLHKIGKCALTSMNVSYGGEKFNVFDQTDAPVQVDLSLSFTELQLQDSASYAAGY